jgi:hypothetical protein
VWCGHPRQLLGLSFAVYHALDLKVMGGSSYSREEFCCAATTRNPNSGTRNSVLAPCRDGDSEEIIAIIITATPPSAIYDSPIHV